MDRPKLDRSQPVTLLIALLGLVAAACGPQAEWQQNMQMAQQAQTNAGADFCAERIPAARDRIDKLYRNGSTGVVSAEVQDPFGGVMSVSIDASTNDLDSARVESGLSDLVFNCGTGLDNNNCFLNVYLDGQKLGAIPPTATGQVAYQCLTAGRHNLRIESVTDLVYDDVIELESDTRYLARVVEQDDLTSTFEIYAENPLPDRIAAVTPEPRQPTVVVTTPAAPPEPSPPDATPVPPDPPPSDGDPISDDELDELLRYLSRAESEHDRFELLEEETQQLLLTSGQAAEIVGLFVDSELRVDAAISLYGAVADPERYYRVLKRIETQHDVRVICRALDLRFDDCAVEPPNPPPAAPPSSPSSPRAPTREPQKPISPNVSPPPVAQSQPAPLSTADFQGLLESVNNASFSDDKVASIRAAAESGWFTAAQAAQLVDALDFSDAQETAAILLYPRLVDPHNFYQVLDALEFSASKDTVTSNLGI